MVPPSVKSLGAHWSAGVKGNFNSSTYLNQRASTRLTPAVEYDLFPYADATRRQLRFQYGIGLSCEGAERELLHRVPVDRRSVLQWRRRRGDDVLPVDKPRGQSVVYRSVHRARVINVAQRSVLFRTRPLATNSRDPSLPPPRNRAPCRARSGKRRPGADVPLRYDKRSIPLARRRER